MKLLNFAIIKLTTCLIIGILLGYYIEFKPQVIITTSVVLLIVFGIGILIAKPYRKYLKWVNILSLLIMICLGSLTLILHEQHNIKNHYTKSSSFQTDSIYTIEYRIKEVLKPGNYYNKYVIEVLKIDNRITSGKSLLNVQKDTLSSILKVDNILISKTKLKDLIPPLNPHQFDYKNYLKKQHIYHQLFITSRDLLLIQRTKHTLYGYASQLRDLVNIKLRKFNFNPNELAIINALLLGQRQDISKEIYNSYTQAGAIHILAVSGLHVGIILVLLNILFKPIERIKNGRLVKIILVVIILWSFAIIAGLSASVVRAVSMFTIVAIAINLKRPTNVYNTLAISIFLLLLFKPTFIFDVGFQLSYLAVFAIVIIQPMLDKLWRPKYKLTNFFWNIFTVTVSAQFGIIPISLYYFHQFPGLFFVSNLVIIPFLGAILGLGILIIGLALVNLLPDIAANFYGAIIELMNKFVAWVSGQESFLFQNISFNIEHVFICYLLLIFSLIWVKQRNFKNTLYLLITILICQSFLLLSSTKSSYKSFIVFHKSRHTIIGHQQKENLNLYLSPNDSAKTSDKLLTNYKVGEHIASTTVNPPQDIYTFNNRTLLVIDSLGIYKVKTFKPNIILLSNSPKINLTRLINTLQPELIISDGSNFKSYQERWKLTCTAKKIPFYQTSKKGAFIYQY